MTLQVIAQTVAVQAVAALLLALARCRNTQTLGLRPVPARTKPTPD